MVLKIFRSVSGASNLGNMARWRKPIMVCGPYSQCLSGASLGNPNHVVATKGHREALGLDRCGLLEVLLHQDIHHIFCDNQERSFFFSSQLTLRYLYLMTDLFNHHDTTIEMCFHSRGNCAWWNAVTGFEQPLPLMVISFFLRNSSTSYWLVCWISRCSV